MITALRVSESSAPLYFSVDIKAL